MADPDPTTPRTPGRDPARLRAPARRGALATLLVLAAAPTATAAPAQGTAVIGDDAELIAVCAGLCDAQKRFDALLRDHPARTPAEERAQAPVADALHARVVAATELAASLPALTAAGLLAKGRAALAVGDKDFEGRNVAADDPAWLMLSAVEDLVDLLEPMPNDQG